MQTLNLVHIFYKEEHGTRWKHYASYHCKGKHEYAEIMQENERLHEKGCETVVNSTEHDLPD